MGYLVRAGGMTRKQSNLLAFRVSQTCLIRWTSSLQWHNIDIISWIWTQGKTYGSKVMQGIIISWWPHLLLFPPSWLHSSNVKPSNFSVCCGKRGTMPSPIQWTQGRCTVHDASCCGTGPSNTLPLQRPLAHWPALQSHLHSPEHSCSPCMTNRQTAAEGLRRKRIYT